MTPERWRQITGIFVGAVAIDDSAARDAYLLQACAGDTTLRAEIESLLAAHVDASAALDDPALPDMRKPNRLAPGTMLGPYRVEELLGAGGMGEVYRARDTRLGRTVALKILPTHLRTSPQLLSRLEREARAVALLNHPYICTLHDVGRQGDIDYLVMEFVEGETLSNLLHRGPLSIDRAISLTREVAEALAAAHAKGIIHRDIKPSNVMVTRAGHVKVVDFGLARESSLLHRADSTRDGRTEPGVRLGTPYYMSPEQALGDSLDARTDLFSLGVVLFECLTAERPFEGKTRSSYLENVLAGRVRAIKDLRAGVPAALEALIAHCLERDPTRRLDSASWLASELDAITRTRKPRHPLAWRGWAAGAALLAAAGATFLLWWQPAAIVDLWRQRAAIVDSGVAQLRRLTTSPGDESDSHLSPDGMWMSFVALQQGERRLYSRQVDGDQIREVTLPPGELQSHIWSPDQREFACLIWRDQSWVVHIVPGPLGAGIPRVSLKLPRIPRNAQLLRWVDNTIYLLVEELKPPPSLRRLDTTTGRLDVLTGPWSSMRVRSFDVSPDGRRVVWSATAAGTQRDDLWVADLAGGNFRSLTSPSDESRKRFPLWRGLEDKVIYQSGRGGQIDLWELDLATGQSDRLTTDPAIEEPDSTSREGSISYQLTAERTSLYVWKSESARGVQISNDGLSEFSPHVSQNGRVVFQRSQASPVEGFLQTDSDILLADITPTGLSGATKIATGFAPRLSPDGRHVAYFQRSGNPPRTDLVVMNTETRVSVPLSSAMATPTNHAFPVTFYEQNAAWISNDELYFYGPTGDRPTYRVVRYRVGGSTEPLPATETRDRIKDLYPSADGKSVAYVTHATPEPGERGRYRLHLLEVATGSDQVVAELGTQFYTHLRGWLDGERLAVARSVAVEPGSLFTYELMTVSRRGEIRTVKTISHVVSFAHLSPKRSELFFTRRVGGVGNLIAYSFAANRERQLTENAAIDVTFGGTSLLGTDQAIGIRHEQTSDIHLLDVRRPALSGGSPPSR